MAESYSIISPDAADSDAADRARWYYAPFYYANVKFASQLCREFAAAESLNHGLSAHLHKAHDCLPLIVEHSSHIKAPPQCRDAIDGLGPWHRGLPGPEWPAHEALIRFDVPLKRLTTKFRFLKMWISRFFNLRGSRLYYSNGDGGYPDSLEGSLSFMQSNPAPDGRHCIDLTGCWTAPLERNYAPEPEYDGHGRGFAFKIRFSAGCQLKCVYLAADDDATRQRCMRIIRAASAGGASSLRDIASAAALTPDLIMMRSVPAVSAVLAALGKAPARDFAAASPQSNVAVAQLLLLMAAGLDLPALRAAGFTAAQVKAAGCDLASARSAGYPLLSLVAAFGYDAVAASGCDMSCILRDGSQLYATLHCLKVGGGEPYDDARTKLSIEAMDAVSNYFVECSAWPMQVPAGWVMVDDIEDSRKDAKDVLRVCREHPWQCDKLIFQSRNEYGTARNPSYDCEIGTVQRCRRWCYDDIPLPSRRFNACDLLLRLSPVA